MIQRNTLKLKRARMFGLLLGSLVFFLVECVIVFYKRKHGTYSMLSPGWVFNMIENNEQVCVHPNLPLWSDQITKFIEKPKPIDCINGTLAEDWVYTGNGKFYISSSAEKKYGRITCAYYPIVFHNDTYKVLLPIYPMTNESMLVSEAFNVSCKSSKGHKYVNTHMCVQKTQCEGDPNKFNVLIIAFDSVSRHMFQRLLPVTHAYFIHSLGGVLLEGYNIVGDGTPAALMPILTGMRETEVPETRKRKPNAKHVDEQVEMIWKRFERKGYITTFSEDLAEWGTFQYRMTGFKHQPVHHYTRPFHLAATKIFDRFNKYCLGARPRHRVFLDWLKDIILTDYGCNFFTFAFFSEYSHNFNSLLALTDEENVQFLQFLKDSGLLENSFLFLISDHGSRVGGLRMTEVGKLEERMPYFGIYAPTKFKLRFPKKFQTLKKNAKRLTIPSDIYKTFLDILGEPEEHNYNNISERSHSLFTPISKRRTCQSAEISPHWCACQEAVQVSIESEAAEASALAVVDKINQLMSDYMEFCISLSLKRIIKIEAVKTNEQVLKFNGSADFDGWHPSLAENSVSERLTYQVTLETTPGSGIFEATVTRFLKMGQYFVDDKDISRLNLYGNAPKCILELNPALRPYCLCKV